MENSQSSESSLLYLVPTPIGNLQDITLRAIEVLKSVDSILAEDTRKTRILLDFLQIQKPLFSYHNFNEHQKIDLILQKLQEGQKMALVSDAGTPGISDPGFLLVRAAVKAQIPLECLPGPNALIPALVESGLPCDRFVFEGFLPHKKGRQTRLKALVEESRTMVFYESPHRILKTLKELGEYLGSERPASISRELTKKFGETRRGSLADLLEHFSQGKIRGEFVLVVQGK